MAYGGPATMADVEEYYTNIRGGRKPTREQLEDLMSRYRAIGGPSPLLEITGRQAAGLRQALAESGSETSVFSGMKHSPPFIGEAVREAAEAGVTELLCIALAPHYSKMSIGGYARAVEDAKADSGGRLRTKFVDSWHREDGFVNMWSGLVRRAKEAIPDGAALTFTAHSLPERIIREGDPYRDQLLESSRLIAREAGVEDWTFAFQSASKTGEPWLGPDVLDRLGELYEEGRRSFLLAPIGFVSDHLEILYDIDVECKGWARERGATLERCDSPNDSRELIECLKGLVARNGFA